MTQQAKAATGQNVVMWAGDEIRLRFRVTDQDGNPTSLLGASGFWFLEDRSGAVLVTKDGTTGVTIEQNGDLWDVVVALVNADTAALVGAFPQFVRIRDADGRPLTIATGLVTIKDAPQLPA